MSSRRRYIGSYSSLIAMNMPKRLDWAQTCLSGTEAIQTSLHLSKRKEHRTPFSRSESARSTAGRAQIYGLVQNACQLFGRAPPLMLSHESYTNNLPIQSLTTQYLPASITCVARPRLQRYKKPSGILQLRDHDRYFSRYHHRRKERARPRPGMNRFSCRTGRGARCTEGATLVAPPQSVAQG
jgi:hypothetical protein